MTQLIAEMSVGELAVTITAVGTAAAGVVTMLVRAINNARAETAKTKRDAKDEDAKQIRDQEDADADAEVIRSKKLYDLKKAELEVARNERDDVQKSRDAEKAHFEYLLKQYQESAARDAAAAANARIDIQTVLTKIDDKQSLLSDCREARAAQEVEIAHMKADLKSKDEELAQRDKQIASLQAEISELQKEFGSGERRAIL